MAVVVTGGVADVPPQKKRTARRLSHRWAVCYLDTSKHVTAVEVIITHEQIACKLAPIEVTAQIFGDIVQHSAILCKLLGKIFFARPLTAIGFTEIFKNAILTPCALIGEVSVKSLLLILIEFSILTNKVKCALVQTALAIPLTAEIFKIEKCEFGVSLITVQVTAHCHKLIVIGELGKVKPCAIQRPATIIFVVSADEHGRIALSVITLVIIEIVNINLNIIEIGGA